MAEKSEIRKNIEEKERELRLAGLRNKILQFDIALLKTTEEAERLNYNKRLCEEEVEKLINPPASE